MKQSILLLACLLLTLGAAPPGKAPVEIREWPVPWEDTRPRDPAVDARGRVWFVGQTGDYIGRLDPGTGKFDRFELEPETGPHNLIVGRDGAIGYDPKTRRFFSITEIPSGGSTVRHMVFATKKKELWFGTDKNTIARAKVT